MGINQKFRTLDGDAQGAGAKADEALTLARAVATHLQELAKAAGYEVKTVPAEGELVRLIYRRRLPSWLAWVRRLGVCR